MQKGNLFACSSFCLYKCSIMSRGWHVVRDTALILFAIKFAVLSRGNAVLFNKSAAESAERIKS